MINIPADLKGQKAVPFMEQFGLTERLGTELSLKEITSIRWTYYVFYSQPFEAGMFAELFQYEKKSYEGTYTIDNNHSVLFFKPPSTFFIARNDYDSFCNNIPKTLNDFIAICNNSGVELKWKEK